MDINQEKNKIAEAMMDVLALAGYDIIDGNRTGIIIRNNKEDRDYKIKIEELIL